MTSTTRNFSPDGMRGAPDTRHHDINASHREPKSDHKSHHHHGPKVEIDDSHDFYDDGLVHSHHWAASN
jgi:hypothetical protein